MKRTDESFSLPEAIHETAVLQLVAERHDGFLRKVVARGQFEPPQGRKPANLGQRFGGNPGADQTELTQPSKRGDRGSGRITDGSVANHQRLEVLEPRQCRSPSILERPGVTRTHRRRRFRRYRSPKTPSSMLLATITAVPGDGYSFTTSDRMLAWSLVESSALSAGIGQPARQAIPSETRPIHSCQASDSTRYYVAFPLLLPYCR